MNSLILKKEIFSLNNIIQTISIYKDYADIQIENQEREFVLIFSNCKYNALLTIKEFENYLIGMENS